MRKATRKGRRGENLRGRKLPGSGRKKGVEPKITRVTREFFQHLLDRNAEAIEDALKKTLKRNPTMGVRLATNLAEFCLPKLKSVENTVTLKRDLKDLTDEEIIQLLAERGAQRAKSGEPGEAPRQQTKH